MRFFERGNKQDLIDLPFTTLVLLLIFDAISFVVACLVTNTFLPQWKYFVFPAMFFYFPFGPRIVFLLILAVAWLIFSYKKLNDMLPINLHHYSWLVPAGVSAIVLVNLYVTPNGLPWIQILLFARDVVFFSYLSYIWSGI